MCNSFHFLCYVEDQLFKMPKLYFLWTSLFLANLVCFFTDDTIGPSRDFLFFTSLFSTVYPAFSVFNELYGNKMPSTFLLIMGPLHQFSFWLFLAYYAGDVYGDHALGVMNVITTAILATFSFGLVFKLGFFVLYPNLYEEYVKSFKTK